MKSILTTLTSLGLALILVFSICSIAVGAGSMLHSLYVHTSIMQGFQIFCFGITIFLLTTATFIIAKVLTGTEVLIEVMTEFLNREIEKKENNNPLQNLFGSLGSNTSTTIKIGKIDEDGNVTPIDENEPGLSEDFLKHRDSFIANAFGFSSGTISDGGFSFSPKQLEDMNIEELEEEKKKAVDKQDFEKAAAILALIEKKKSE